MVITTSYTPPQSVHDKALELSRKYGTHHMERRNQSIAQLRKRAGSEPIIVVTADGLKADIGAGHALRFHPGTALIRIKRLLKGEQDNLLRCTGIKEGSRILDCTAGLASDSIVCSYAAGPSGNVTSLESEALIHMIVQEGLNDYTSEVGALNNAMRRIQLLHQDYLPYLLSLPDDSFDVVYFDPMFRETVSESSAMDPLRQVANRRTVTVEAVREAVRVGGKIVMKERKDSPLFHELGFEQVYQSYSTVAYGVMQR